MTDLVARRCLVSGHVQGVFFRASARKQAIELGLSGYAANLSDGRVEVVVVGERQRAQRLIEWLKQGPPAARVDEVEVEDVPLERLQTLPVGFATR